MATTPTSTVTDSVTPSTPPLPPQPPRATGNTAQDVSALIYWVNQFYQFAFLQQSVLTAAGQATASDFDPNSLPDPATSTVATAQNTANQAYALADQASQQLTTLQKSIIASGSIEISGSATTAVITLPAAEPDTSYQVLLTVSAIASTPALGALQPIGIAKTTTQATVTLDAAPGGVTSVTFDYLITRNP